LRGQDGVVQILLADDRVDPDSQDRFGLRPLTCAVTSGNEVVVKLLLAKGVEQDSKGPYKWKWLSILVTGKGYDGIIKPLVKESVDPEHAK
jgi:hypothetical protein